MACAHESSILEVAKAASARYLEDIGCDYVIHHIGYDERRYLIIEPHENFPMIMKGGEFFYNIL
tara:strand:- start:1030 stop:1221 length:192 start_codon:yes stop_codon:yes gene_type:complete